MAAVRAISWNGSSSRDGNPFFSFHCESLPSPFVVTICHGTPLSFPVPKCGNCAFALCPLFPIKTDDSNPSTRLASSLQAMSVKEQN